MANEARWPKMMRCNVECSRWPKMMGCNAGRPQERIKGCNHIHSLCDDLLLEILLRLPNCKSVAQCKCVCKRWAALASHPRFFDQFIRLKLGDGVRGTGNETSAIVMRYEWSLPDKCKLYQEFESFLRPSIFHAQYSSFSTLHCLGEDNASAAVLIASCQDLLLYCRHENDKYDYYISNVQTRQYVMLPSPPKYYDIELLHVGFICDPFYSCGKEIVINAAYHYSVVVLRCHDCHIPSTKFSVQLLSSHCDNQWCDRVLSSPKPCTLWSSRPHHGFCFCFDGKLHFSGMEGFFGFDHNNIEFDDEIQCHFVKWPVGLLQGKHRVGVSQGSLRISAYCDDLKVWALEDYNAGNWMLQHRVELGDWVPRDPWMTKKLKKFKLYPGHLCHLMLVNVLGFHPNNSNVIYLHVPGCIFLCNLSTKTLELACHIPVAAAKTCRHYLSTFYGFPVVFRIWPTPLPPLVQGLKVGVNTTPAFCCGHRARG